MKRFMICGLLAALVILSAVAKNRLVILHTNDTHSQIDPRADGTGGILQIKAVMDSVANAEKNVVRIDAGDMVQGSLYFKFFGGDVEYPLFNMMGYDYRVLGNHEFDNGMASLAHYYKDVEATSLSANYDFSGTDLKGVFKPFAIKKIGGKKIGFIGLNVDPSGLISQQNYEGITFNNIIPEANKIADYLKTKEKCDLVVAITHIGYTSEHPGAETDPMLAANSRNIDLIIGGHSHTVLDPAHPEADKPVHIKNLDGKPVLICQAGRYGRHVGKVDINLDNPSDMKSELIAVTDRFPRERLDRRMADFIAPFRAKVDSVNHHVVARSSQAMRADVNVGSYPNWEADYAQWLGNLVADSLGLGCGRVDMGLMNVGGIRQDMPQGEVSEGLLLATFPFANRMTIIEISGAHLQEAMQAAARKGGEGVSQNVRVVTGPDGVVDNVIIDGKPIDARKSYLVCTIDYLANGNDYLDALALGKRIWTDDRDMSERILRYVKMLDSYGLPLQADPNPRFIFR